MVKPVVLAFIRAYQKTISPDHGLASRLFPDGYCKFEPTCSQYGYDAIVRFGVIKGIWLGTKRVARCNPWTKGGHDPVPGPSK